MARATESLDDEDASEPAAVEPRVPTAISRIDLERAIAQLPEGCRAAFVLHDVEGLDHREVAAALGISEGTSKSQVHKARHRLRGLLSARVLQAPGRASATGQSDMTCDDAALLHRRLRGRRLRPGDGRRRSATISRPAPRAARWPRTCRGSARRRARSGRWPRPRTCGPESRHGCTRDQADGASTADGGTCWRRRPASRCWCPACRGWAHSCLRPAPERRRSPSVELGSQFQLAEAAYQTAIADLESITAQAEAPALAEPAFVALQASLVELDEAIGEARGRLSAEPDDEFSQDSLLTALDNKVILLQDTVALLDQERADIEGVESMSTRITAVLCWPA